MNDHGKLVPRSPNRSPRTPRTPRTPRDKKAAPVGVVPLGWVTIRKDGRDLVSTATNLAAGERQTHMVAWARRRALDKSLAVQAADRLKAKEKAHARHEAGVGGEHGRRRAEQPVSVFHNELSSDPTGIGFAFGGLEPGRLHAHGKVVDTHKVYYSICLVGTYHLHVGLRSQGVPIPGSPFKLRVVPGQAHAQATTIPKEVPLPLKGSVGMAEEFGCGPHRSKHLDAQPTSSP